MRKGDLISLALSRIGGDIGGGTTEMDVHPATVRRLVEAAIRYHFVVDYRQARRELASIEGLPSVRSLSPVGEAFITEQQLPVERSGATANFHPRVVIPHQPMLLSGPGLHWLRECYCLGPGGRVYPGGGVEIIASLRQLRGIQTDLLEGTTFCRPVIRGGSYSLEFTGLDAAVAEVLLSYVRDPVSFTDREHLPLPAASEVPILQLVVEWATGQRMLPSDGITNDQDDAETGQRRGRSAAQQ